MSKKQKKDELTLENLERIVAGKKLNDDPELDDDTRAALELTREMKSWPKSPSKEFKTQLKAQIIHRLAEQEKQEGFKNRYPELWEIPRRFAWQFTIASLTLIIVTGLIFLIVYLMQH